MTPPSPHPLPDPWNREVFAVRDALAEGITHDRLRSRDLEARVVGARGPAGTADSLAGRCALLMARLGADVFVSHSSAARLWGVPLPARFERMTRVHLSVESPSRAPHARGVIGHSRVVVPGDVRSLGGMRVSSPARVWCEMASVLPVPDLVAVTDALIGGRHPLASASDLAERLGGGDRLSRSPRLRSALDLADGRAESRPESLVRVALAAGGVSLTPNPEVQGLSGRRYRVDLADPASRIAVEYHGDYHREADQWRRDVGRRADLEAVGWTFVEVTADDLSRLWEVVDRVRAAITRGCLPVSGVSAR